MSEGMLSPLDYIHHSYEFDFALQFPLRDCITHILESWILHFPQSARNMPAVPVFIFSVSEKNFPITPDFSGNDNFAPGGNYCVHKREPGFLRNVFSFSSHF